MFSQFPKQAQSKEICTCEKDCQGAIYGVPGDEYIYLHQPVSHCGKQDQGQRDKDDDRMNSCKIQLDCKI